MFSNYSIDLYPDAIVSLNSLPLPLTIALSKITLCHVSNKLRLGIFEIWNIYVRINI